MYEFLYDFVKRKCGKKSKLRHRDTDILYTIFVCKLVFYASLIEYIKTDYIYRDIARRRNKI